jgi:HK97 family phage portal protein
MTEPLDWARVTPTSMGNQTTRRNLSQWTKLNARQGRELRARRDGADLILEAFAGSGRQPQVRNGGVNPPGFDAQIMAAFGWTDRPWHMASIAEALGVPAILRAVSLISNVGGALSMNAYRRGVQLDPEDRPRLIVRPNPFSTPRDFYRDTFYSMATRGEAWWWVAARDQDDNPLSLIPVNPVEIQVVENPNDLRYPTITWRGKDYSREDLRQITYLKEPGALRGYGPLQACSAAVSISVESQEWAANFFADGGYPSIWIKVAGSLGGGEDGWSTEEQTSADDPILSEAQRLKEQWISTPPNTPKVTDESIEDIRQFDPNPQGAQMLDARTAQVGDATRMFGIPGKLLEYIQSGSSLTYQNLAEVMTDFLKTCLIPNYLEPVEQAMSDLLTNSTVSRFNVEGVNRADIKTRYEVYQIGIDAGILTAEMAQRDEGIIPGDVEVAPMPLAPPAAVPASVPSRSGGEVRCDGLRTRRRSGVSYMAKCDKLLSTSGEFIGTCPRCKKVYEPVRAA